MFAVKFQIVQGKPDGTCDYRGAEPNDTHRTIAELDPVEDSELDIWMQRAQIVNQFIGDLTPANDFGHVELRIMDSDNRV